MFTTEKYCVFFEVRTELLNIIHLSFGFKLIFKCEFV
jgi:hypothetical protein